jgi:hypothetical protein
MDPLSGREAPADCAPPLVARRRWRSPPCALRERWRSPARRDGGAALGRGATRARSRPGGAPSTTASRRRCATAVVWPAPRARAAAPSAPAPDVHGLRVRRRRGALARGRVARDRDQRAARCAGGCCWRFVAVGGPAGAGAGARGQRPARPQLDATTRQRLDHRCAPCGATSKRRRATGARGGRPGGRRRPARRRRRWTRARPGSPRASPGRATCRRLEIVGSDGRLLSSHHWPAGFGLADRGRHVRGRRGLPLGDGGRSATCPTSAWPRPPRRPPPGADAWSWSAAGPSSTRPSARRCRSWRGWRSRSAT